MVKTNEAASKGPQDTKGVDGDVPTAHTTDTTRSDGQRLVVASALALSWQLALVVIVPILGGFLLDQHYHRSPLLTLAGLLVALIGVFGVLSRLAAETGHDNMNKPEGKS